jgi:hypothetical protein
MKQQSSHKTKLTYALVGMLAGFLLTAYYKESNVIEVDKIQERERVVTRIVERPDGSKTTEIIKETDKTETHLSKKSAKKDWLVGVTSSLNENTPNYGVQVSRRVILDLYVGGYAKTDGELGVIVTYSF